MSGTSTWPQHEPGLPLTAELQPTLKSSPLKSSPLKSVTSRVETAEDLRRSGSSTLVSPTVVRGMARASEFIIVCVTGWLTAAVATQTVFPASAFDMSIAMAVTAAIAVVAFQFLGLYALGMFARPIHAMPRLMLGWCIAIAALVFMLFFVGMNEGPARTWIAAWYISGGLGIVIFRFALAKLVRTWARTGKLYQRAVIYGAVSVTADLIAQFEADPNCDVRIAGIFDDRVDERVMKQISCYPHLGGLADLITYCRTGRVDLVIVSLPFAAESRLTSVMKRLSVLPADVKVPARATQLRFSPRTYSHVGSVAMIDLLDKPIADWDRVSKWLFDKIVAATALVLLSPVMAAVAIAVKLDSKGPALFRQRRYGFNNEAIEVYKFRSMYTDLCDPGAVKLVTKTDPRVTAVGRFIRKTSLDELPQLFNVLKGDLSLVGPRPHAMQAKAADRLYQDVVDGYYARHKVKPGISGWAQINGWRGETDTPEKIEKRVEHDLFYIENWSVFLDLYILVKTPWSLLNSKNAY